jgi:mRNA interferase MazF
MIEEQPPRIRPILKRAPRVREVYWCDFWHDARLPEMWKRRPVLIISLKNTVDGEVTLLPFTTSTQINRPYSHVLKNPIGKAGAAILCNYPITLSTSRLIPYGKTTPVMDYDEFQLIIQKLYSRLPRI